MLTFESMIKFSKGIRSEIGGIVKGIRYRYLIKVFKKYRSYPIYVLPGTLVSNFGNQMPVYLFAIYFDSALVGMFALANSLVLMPLSILINSSTTVFLQKAAELKQTNPEELGPFIYKLYDRLIVFSAIPLIIFAVGGEWVLDLILGQEWARAGFFASLKKASAVLSFDPIS